MLDENKSHAIAGGKRLHELSAGIKTACRRAYSNDQKIVRAPRWATYRRGSPARSDARSFGPRSLVYSHFVNTRATHSRRKRFITIYLSQTFDQAMEARPWCQ
jgi:hypothetical protein